MDRQDTKTQHFDQQGRKRPNFSDPQLAFKTPLAHFVPGFGPKLFSNIDKYRASLLFRGCDLRAHDAAASANCIYYTGFQKVLV